MRHIVKTEPPEEFLEFCKTPDVCFDDLSGEPKRALRKRLLEDQGYICCYCGCRIENDENTKIEHIKCQEYYGDYSLDFNNLLASCDGGEHDRANKVRPKHKCHCDAKKENQDIAVSPLDDGVEALFTYFDDGTVKGTGDATNTIQTLGLNTKYLISRRKSLIKTLLNDPPDNLEEELSRLKSMHNGKFDEFCFVLEQQVSLLLAVTPELAVAT